MPDNNKNYTEALKLKVIREFEDGASISHLRRKYGIRGNSTIQKWIRKYSHKASATSNNKQNNQEEVERLKERISQLEKAVLNLTVEKLVLESTLEVYEEEYGARLGQKKDADHRESEAERKGRENKDGSYLQS